MSSSTELDDEEEEVLTDEMGMSVDMGTEGANTWSQREYFPVYGWKDRTSLQLGRESILKMEFKNLKQHPNRSSIGSWKCLMGKIKTKMILKNRLKQ